MTDSSVFTPSLFLKRLVVMSNGERVYDENFYTGLNIIRGMNGTGKTTIADFIFFGLGGENVHWKEEALRCDYVYCEVFVSGQIWTFLKAPLTRQLKPLMDGGIIHFLGLLAGGKVIPSCYLHSLVFLTLKKVATP